jgi:arsenate reductase (thioredoxin)
MLPKLKVLFLCTGNSCRSQMAEGWARRLLEDRVEPYSAGVAPTTIDPRAVRVMQEVGVDLVGQRSKHLDELSGLDFDIVVTVCDDASRNCPRFPGKTRRTHAGFDDPPRLAQSAHDEEEALTHYRRVRDEIRSYVETLPRELEQLIGKDRSRRFPWPHKT